ncbi:MAG: hypothetical protein ACKPEN_21240 [Planktothrix sp.]|uniref:hypothetical protein n=1 Tax=Planktothrix sp. TaxID=3088171 RepID=UPI0038D364CE
MDIPKVMPNALTEFVPSLTPDGLAFHAPKGMSQTDVVLVFRTLEDWLEGLANQWGSVSLRWDGCRTGLTKYAHWHLSANDNDDVEINKNTDIKTSSNQLIRPMAESELISEILGYDGGSCCLLRMADDSPLFSNNSTERTSGIRPNDWIKVKDHSPWWLGTELSDYKARLLRDGGVNNYSYAARFIGAGGQVHQFTVNTRLVDYRGDICRLVKNVSCVPIEL